MSIPIIATVFFIGLFSKLSLAHKILRHFEVVSGILLIVFGALIFTNDLQAWAGIITSKLTGVMGWLQIFEEKLLHFN
jgi:hypothetical protein